MRVEYERVPELFDWMLEEVEVRGRTLDIYKDGKPFVRMMPASVEDEMFITDAG